MTNRKNGISRRKALTQLGVSLSALTVGCAGGAAIPEQPRADPDADLGLDLGDTDLSKPGPAELLAGIDAVVVLMMENRSFDHYLGQLASDSRYPGGRRPDGLTGAETNPDDKGNLVLVAKLLNYEPKDPPHGWQSCHRQFNDGKNDGFVREYIASHGEKVKNDVMGFHDRSQIPYHYALADRFVVCDRWFASVMGPTWPNRFYLAAGTSGGKKDNSGFAVGGPTTLWDRLHDKKLSGKNYYAGLVAWYFGAFPGRLLSRNPTARMSEFFDDCKKGTLPALSIIDPDYLTSDDHPSHNIQLGQAFIATVLSALFQSPQWSRTLCIITYDEHGGFFDHVAPPKLPDELAEFSQVGFRVPTLIMGPTVRKGFVDSTVYDHTSVGATVATRFGLQNLPARMAAAHDVSAAIDPALVGKPSPPPSDLPRLPLRLSEIAARLGADSQPELTQAFAALPKPLRAALAGGSENHLERTLSWLRVGEALGALTLV